MSNSDVECSQSSIATCLVSQTDEEMEIQSSQEIPDSQEVHCVSESSLESDSESSIERNYSDIVSDSDVGHGDCNCGLKGYLKSKYDREADEECLRQGLSDVDLFDESDSETECDCGS